MRVISQDGTLDVPYEMVTVQRYGTTIYYLNTNLAEGELNGLTLGNYSTKEKATRAMEMLRDAYIGIPIVMQNVDISEDVAMEFERLKKCGIVVQTENQPSKIECISNAIFQFPTEEELE